MMPQLRILTKIPPDDTTSILSFKLPEQYFCISISAAVYLNLVLRSVQFLIATGNGGVRQLHQYVKYDQKDIITNNEKTTLEIMIIDNQSIIGTNYIDKEHKKQKITEYITGLKIKYNHVTPTILVSSDANKASKKTKQK